MVHLRLGIHRALERVHNPPAPPILRPRLHAPDQLVELHAYRGGNLFLFSWRLHSREPPAANGSSAPHTVRSLFYPAAFSPAGSVKLSRLETAAREGAGGVSYMLIAGYPPAPLSDASLTLEKAGLKNASVTQKLA